MGGTGGRGGEGRGEGRWEEGGVEKWERWEGRGHGRGRRVGKGEEKWEEGGRGSEERRERERERWHSGVGHW